MEAAFSVSPAELELVIGSCEFILQQVINYLIRNDKFKHLLVVTVNIEPMSLKKLSHDGYTKYKCSNSNFCSWVSLASYPLCCHVLRIRT